MSEDIADLEEKASNLVESLTQLKKEVEGYSKAKNSIEDVRSDVNSLVSKLDELGSDVLKLTKNISEIGSTEIISSIDEMKESLGTFNNEVVKINKITKSNKESLEKLNHEVVSMGAAVNNNMGYLDKLVKKIEFLNSSFLSAKKIQLIGSIVTIVLVSYLIYEYWF